MFRKFCVIMVIGLLLTACQQAQPSAPTLDTSLSTTAAESVQVTTPALSTVQAQDAGTGPTGMIPGTIIPPTTPDPLAGTPFDRLVFTRSGGITGQTLTVEVLSDGTVTRDGTTSRISPEQVKQLSDTLDRIGFFGLQGVFISRGPGADRFQYSLMVERLGASRTINAEDGYTPPELMALFTVLGQLGVP